MKLELADKDNKLKEANAKIEQLLKSKTIL